VLRLQGNDRQGPAKHYLHFKFCTLALMGFMDKALRVLWHLSCLLFVASGTVVLGTFIRYCLEQSSCLDWVQNPALQGCLIYLGIFLVALLCIGKLCPGGVLQATVVSRTRSGMQTSLLATQHVEMASAPLSFVPVETVGISVVEVGCESRPIEVHSEHVARMISEYLKSHVDNGHQPSNNGATAKLVDPQPAIEQQLCGIDSLNPRGLVMAAQYRAMIGQVEEAIGLCHVALLRCKADMNTCAIADVTIWAYLSKLGASANVIFEMCLASLPAVLQKRGWTQEQITMNGSSEFITIRKQGSAWAVRQDAAVPWTYDRRWCLYYNNEWARSQSSSSGLMQRKPMEPKMAMDFAFGSSGDLTFQAWSRYAFASNAGVGPKMTANESTYFEHISKASAQGKPLAAWPATVHMLPGATAIGVEDNADRPVDVEITASSSVV